MAKTVQLTQNGVNVYPRTIGSEVATYLSGSTTPLTVNNAIAYLHAKESGNTETISDIIDGTQTVGKAIMDGDNNIISSTYVKTANIGSISNEEINRLFQ